MNIYHLLLPQEPSEDIQVGPPQLPQPYGGAAANSLLCLLGETEKGPGHGESVDYSGLDGKASFPPCPVSTEACYLVAFLSCRPLSTVLDLVVPYSLAHSSHTGIPTHYPVLS